MDLRDLLQSRSARALDEDREGRLLVASDLPGTFQLYELDDGLRQLTDFAEPVSGRYVPASRHVIVQMDTGGNERHQLYLLDAEDPPGSEVSQLRSIANSPEHVHRILGVRPDGGQLAFSSNKRNGIDFDVYLLDLETLEENLVYSKGGWVQEASGYSPGGRYLSFLLPGSRPLDSDLLLVDLRSGSVLRPLPHPDQAALLEAPAWAGEEAFFVSTNVDRDTAAVLYYDMATQSSETVLEGEHDLECFTSRDGTSLVVVANAGGRSQADIYDVHRVGARLQLGPRRELPLPGDGVISASLLTPPPLVGDKGTHVTYSFTSPLTPGDVWRSGPGGRPERLTHSPGPDPVTDGLVEPSVGSVSSFDGETVPLFCYRPAVTGHAVELLPVVVVIHGGPESQSVLSFNPVVQALVARGFAVLVPNVRGSTGYGRRYASLDDTVRRLDSVKDLAAIHSWLESAGLDPKRAALYGGSYGGYMVLAGVAFQPELWAAGVDIVGISDLATFLENTSGYRRAHREREYGSLVDDRAFLEAASPLRRADDIEAPLFVIHGENDPRVPVSEARQLVSSLERRGIAHELLVFADEGHGLAKLANRLVAFPRAIAFLEEHLVGN
ncbi:MAG: S9 family peptidase [Acidimicrobiales bacterium]